jgi:hypothetical protein
MCGDSRPGLIERRRIPPDAPEPSPEAAKTGVSRHADPDAGTPAGRERRHWIPLVLLAGVVVGGAAAVVVALHWPYSERMVLPALQDTFKTQIHIQQLRRFYFPNPGCEIDALTFANSGEGKPIVTAQKMTITGRYTDLIFRPHHLAEIRLDGLYVGIPSSSERTQSKTAEVDSHSGTSDSSPSQVSVGSITANGAVLEIETENPKRPLKFDIHTLKLSSVAANQPLNYQLTMKNPEPPGELESEGAFGPWKSGQIDKTPLHGSVKSSAMKLDRYPGIGGTLRSAETFDGTLDRVKVVGEATAPDFELKSTRHPESLFAQFQVIVNAMEGEARLEAVAAKLGKTAVTGRGSVSKSGPQRKRATTLDFSIPHGRVEDMLWLFNVAAKPPMTGDVTASGHVRVPKFGTGFLPQLELNGQFEIRDGHFQEETQLKVNELSARAQGKKVANPAEAPEVAVTTLSSEVKIGKAVAQLSRLYFEVPGARARVQGTYDLSAQKVDVHGNLWTDATVSKDTSGIASVLLKPVDPLFRRKHAGAMAAVSMTGDIGAPHFWMMPSKRKTAWNEATEAGSATKGPPR